MRVCLITLDDVSKAMYELSPTPNIDRLIATGMYLPNFWAGPNCSGHRARRESGLPGYDPGNLVAAVVKSNEEFSLPVRDGDMLAERVNGDAVLIGKWHVGNDIQHPIECGYRAYDGTPRNLNPGDYFDWEWFHADSSGGEASGTSDEYVTTWVTDRAILAVNDPTIAFVNVNYHAVHKPRHIPPADLHTQGTFLPRDEDKVAAMLEAADTEIGRLLTAAFDNDMLILLCSDNGAAADIGGGKGSMWEFGISTFLVAAGPGVVSGTCTALTTACDLYPTIIDATGGDPNEAPGRKSLMPVLVGDEAALHQFIYTEKFGPIGQAPTAPWSRAVRDHQYKLIENDTQELYDLVNDPNEMADLIGDPSLDEILQALRAELPS